MSRFEKAGIWAGIIGAVAAVIALLPTSWTFSWPAPWQTPPPNTIKIVDAVYISRANAAFNARIDSYVNLTCNYKTSCAFACDNKRTGAGEINKGDDTKQCVINYICTREPNRIINIVKAEDTRGVQPISCPQ